MAKVTIVIEDLDGGGTQLKATPNFELLMSKGSKKKLTSAELVGVFILKKVRDQNAKFGGQPPPKRSMFKRVLSAINNSDG